MTLKRFRKTATIFGIVIVSVAAGAAVTYAISPTVKLPARVAYCASYTFDHVSFLRNVDASERQANEFASTLKSSSDPLDLAKRVYFEDKVKSLRSLRHLIELHVRTNGSSYGCADKAEWLLVHQLDYPTLKSMNRAEELEALWKKVEEQYPKRPWWMGMVQGIGGQLVAALIALFGFYLAEKREKRKEERRIVLAQQLPERERPHIRVDR